MAMFDPTAFVTRWDDRGDVFLKSVDFFEENKNPSLFLSEFSPAAEKN